MLKTVHLAKSRYLADLLWFLLLYALIILALLGSGEEKFEHLHLALDISNATLSLLLMMFLLGEQYQIQPEMRKYLAIGFGFAAATELLHALIGIEWSGWFAWVQIYSGTLRPATWPPSTYVLPLALAWAFWLMRNKTTVKPTLFASVIASLTVGMIALSLFLPRYVDTGILGIQRPTQVPLLFLWAGVIAAYWKERRTLPIYEGLALMGVLLFLSDLCMLYSTSPHEKFTMMAHVGKVIAYAMLHMIQMRIAAEDSQGRSTAEAELFMEKERLRAAVETSMDAVVQMDSEGIITGWSSQAENIFGWRKDEAIGRALDETIIPHQYREAHVRGLKHFLLTGEGPLMNSRIEITGLNRDDHEFPIELSISQIRMNGKYEFSAFIRNITERKNAEAELRISAKAFDSQECMFITDADGVIQRVNNAFTETTGYSTEEAVGKKPSILRSGKYDAKFYKAMFETLMRDGYWHGEIWNKRKNGEIYPTLQTISVVRGDDEEITHYVSAFTDISMRKEAEEHIRELAYIDTLTKLPNRRLLQDRLQQALALHIRTKEQGALLFIDLDHFKSINDTKGHDIGDLLLTEAANRLRSIVREGDTAARLGGDEFVVLIEGMSSNEETAATQAELIGEKILASLGQTYYIHDNELICTVSIGITLFRGEKRTMEEMLKRADVALYQAKADGRNTVRFFDPVLQAIVTTRAALEYDLRRAVSEMKQFQLYYQPQVDASGCMIGAEALLRWDHPKRGMVPPAQFIPLAEESGLILPLGNWVLATACQQLDAWAKHPITAHLILAVNVSARQFGSPTFIEELLTLADCLKVDLTKLKLEITESMMMKNTEDVIEKMNALRSRGITFSMDDFGTGFSSLSYLKRLPLCQLKIDQSFVRDVLTDPNDAAIARTIVALAQSMNLTVIAEGVESEEQRLFFDMNGCHNYQGYLFSQPVPIKQFDALLEDAKPV